jgi:hypothetical protein
MHSKTIVLGNRILKNNGINQDVTFQNIHYNRHRHRKSKPLASTFMKYDKGAHCSASNCDVFLATVATPPISVYLFRILCPGGGGGERVWRHMALFKKP